MGRPLNDSVYLYGFHDPGGEQIMLDAGVAGWVLVTEAIGHDPNDRSGRDYRPLSGRDLGVIVRLNNGYNPDGTLPYERDYANFARRCANFVAASQGAHLWIVGNEPNHPIEWPGAQWNWGPGWPAPISPDKRGEEITPARYASCYKQVRAAIRAVSGHGQDQVLVAAPAPWNILLTYPTNPNGDWVKYFADILSAIGPGNLDGMTLHTYTHGSSPALIVSPEKMGDPRFSNYHYHFRAYRDFVAVIPAAMRALPLYITETNQGDLPWENANTGWVRAAYGEIDGWNRANSQKIRSLLLYRWPQVPGDRWGIEGKGGVIEDFRQALGSRYRWTAEAGGEDPLAALTRRVAELEQAAAALKPQIDSLTKLAADALALRKDAETLAGQVSAANPASLAAQYAALSGQIKALEDAVAQAGGQPGGLQIVDKIGKLPQGPTPYPKRDLSAIKRVVVHHTVTPDTITPERLAQAAVQRGLPGITYHFLITGDGTTYATQPLDSQISQTNKPEVNANSIGVGLAGNFTNTVPTEAQMTSAALLISDLLDRFNLPVGAMVGAREVAQTASPGNQWLSGAKYKNDLVARIEALGAAVPRGDDADILALQQQVAELQGRVSALDAQIAALNRELAGVSGQLEQAQARNATLEQQAAGLRQQVTALEATVKAQAAEIERLRGLVANQAPGRVAKPAVVDKVDKLAKHPTLPPYGKRTRPISMIVVHHTDTPKTMTVEKIAEYHVFGERKDAKGNVIKAQWPGIGYHFLIGPDGVITQGQRESTRSYHVGGDPNDYSVAISLIGRMMTKNYDGTTRAPEDQVPTPQQLRSAGQLAAWLMQEYKVPLEQVKGHRDVWPKSTVCPGEHWKTGRNWHPDLVREIRAAQAATGGGAARPIPLYLLFWDHAPQTGGLRGPKATGAARRGTSPASAPPPASPSTTRWLAQRVVIVGGPLGVSAQDEARLKAGGGEVYRLAGKDEADTKRMLDELAQKGTPWPGAPAETAVPRGLIEAEGPLLADEIAFPDEWTMPDDWELPGAAYYEAWPQRPGPAAAAYPKDIGDLLGGDRAPYEPSPPKVVVPPPGAEPRPESPTTAGAGGSHE